MPVNPPVFVPGLGQSVVFQDRAQMFGPARFARYRLASSLPAPALPIDWAKSLTFPILGNNRYGDCYTSDTEVLTEKGWQSWPDYNGSSSLGTMNPESGHLEFQAPLVLIRKDYDGPVAFAAHKRVDFAVTPTHRMLHRRYVVPKPYTPGSAHYGPLEFKTVAEMPTRFLIPGATTGFLGTKINTLTVGHRTWDGTDFVRLLGLVLSDGYVGGQEHNKNSVSFCCFREDRIDTVRAFAYRLGIEEQASRPGVWRFYDGGLAEWLRKNAYIGDEYRSPCKKVPDLVKIVDADQIDEFLRFFGDQTLHDAGNRTFYSSSWRMVDDLQELLLRVGKRGAIYERGMRRGGINQDGRLIEPTVPAFELYENENSDLGFSQLKRNPVIEYDHYKGEVFCATVPNSTLITRRNGSILVSGNCMYAAALHVDQTMTGNVGKESSFDENTVIQAYLRLAGGDYGLDEGTLVGAWKEGLVSDKDVSILDALDVDPENGAMVQSAMYLFGTIFFMLSVPNKWISSFDPSTVGVWDAPAIPNPANGHGVIWNSCDLQGRYRLQTWGGSVWITPAGVRVCQPSAFITFSLRWFDPKTGKAPNGYSYDQLAAFWVQAGGAVLPPSPFGPTPPGPTPPTPGPVPSSGIIYVDTEAHVVSLPDGWSVVPIRKI